MPDNLKHLQTSIDYVFADVQLLQRALTHRSANQTKHHDHMERLEFLGDAVLGLVVSAYLHQHFPAKPEGDLSRMRAALVRKESLLRIALSWNLVVYLNVGESERQERAGADSSGIKSPSISANAVEAVIGAVFEDGGWTAAHKLVMQAWQDMLKGIGDVDTRDAKSRLQELTQAKGWGLPEYSLLDAGAGQSPRFEAQCRVNGELFARGRGERKKLAEIEAAEKAWQQLKT